MNKSKQPAIKLNLLMNMILTMSSFIFPLITFPYVSRILLAEGNGKVQMAASFVAYFSLLAQLGIPTHGIRACAAARDNKLELTRAVHELIVIQSVTVLLSYALFTVCLAYIPKLQNEKTLYLITSARIFFGAVGMEWLFKALERYSYITIRSLVFKVISLVAMFLLVHSKEDYVIYGGISVMAAVGSNIMNLSQIPKYVYLKPVGNYNFKKHLKPIFVLFAYVCATTIYTNLDSVMLGFMTTDTDVGYYSVAIKIKDVLVSVVTALGVVLLPRVSYYYEQGRLDEFWNMAAKALRVVLLISIPLAVYFMIYADNSIYFLSGDGYAGSILPMIVIMPTLICIGVTSVTGVQVLIPTKRENIVLYASIVGAVVDCILNVLLIPSLRATGAAIGTLAAEAVVLVIHLWVLWKDVHGMMKIKEIGKILGATIISGLASAWVMFIGASDFVTLALSASLFFCVYAVLLHIFRESAFMQIEETAKTWIQSKRKH